MEVGVAHCLKGHMTLMIGSGVTMTITCDDHHSLLLITINIKWITDDHLTTLKALLLLEVKVHLSMTLQ